MTRRLSRRSSLLAVLTALVASCGTSDGMEPGTTSIADATSGPGTEGSSASSSPDPATETTASPTSDSGPTAPAETSNAESNTAADTGGGDEGECAPVCATVDDCLYGEMGTSDCIDGLCEFTPTCDPKYCAPLDCVDDRCVNLCATDEECTQPQACTGVGQRGESFCEWPFDPCTPGEPCSGWGVCNATGDACICNVDADCAGSELPMGCRL